MKYPVKSTFLLMLSMSRFFGRSGHWKRCWIQQAKYVNTETGSEDPDLASERAPGIWVIPRLGRTNEPCVSQLVHSWGDICNLSSCTLSKVSIVLYSYLRKFPFLFWAEAPDFYTWLFPALSLLKQCSESRPLKTQRAQHLKESCSKTKKGKENNPLVTQLKIIGCGYAGKLKTRFCYSLRVNQPLGMW